MLDFDTSYRKENIQEAMAAPMRCLEWGQSQEIVP